MSCIVVLYIIHLFIDEFRGWMVAKRLPWLYSVETKGSGRLIHEVEQNVESGSIVYLVTPDLFNDARRRSTINVVKSNLKRGITYIYITQDHPQARRNIDMVQCNFAEFGKQVEVYVLNEVFGLMPTYNILALERDVVGILRVFVELPVKDPSDSRGLRHLWAEADAELGNRWHGRILDMLKDCTPFVNPYLSRSEN